MTRILIMLAIAALILAPSNPAGLLILFALAALRVWRTGDAMDMESDYPPGGAGSGAPDQPGIFRHGDLT